MIGPDCLDRILAGMLSYARGPETEVLDLTLGDLLRECATKFPQRLGLVSRHQGVRLTWTEFHEKVVRTAAGLQSLGLRPGDRIGVWSTNCAEWVYLQFGAATAGVILVNVNPAYRSHELSYVLRVSRIKYLFMRESDNHANYRKILEESLQGQHCELEGAIYLNTPEWDALLDPLLPFDPPRIDAGDVTNIQYTSGTTGAPKGAMLSHRNVVNDGRFIADRMRLTDEDRICIPVPLYHCFGCVIGTIAATASGAAIILPAAAFDAGVTLATIQEERATAVYGVPAMFIAELNHPSFASTDFSSLRTGVMAGSPCPIEVMKRVVKSMHVPEITICYGQTETSPVTVMSDVSDSIEFRCSTVGRPMPATEIRLIDRTTGHVVPVGEQGELCARGPLVMVGYDGDPEATKKAISPDGWLYSGDLAVMLEDSSVRITGRAKDMIIRGGENIYPREIEEYLYTHPVVDEVQVIGVPHQRLGEVVCAWIRVKPGHEATADEIQEYCRGRIAYFKIPELIRFVDAFPITVTGKIQKFRMREAEIQERGLGELSNTVTA
jgi:fatty-acyl-CoA synthase